MRTNVNLNELRDAMEWVSAADAAALDCDAYVCKETGKNYWAGEGVEEEFPEDIDDGSLYVSVPHKHDFRLGRSLAIRFAQEYVSNLLQATQECFRRRKAYAVLKSMLARTGQLEAWYQCESHAIDNALREWCEEQGFNPC
ncbi:hypothetical protein [Inhella proteolytica]|uniref:Uncharacterized protein n=1 Tax=Inhella proteolytica TaxID=2795029 RepID=A0A931IZC9_9BURK|nr:hypothetical protein [Inhella proteolytica]MBH9575275.1 hypothetical protein [Inhella proteolytica]